MGARGLAAGAGRCNALPPTRRAAALNHAGVEDNGSLTRVAAFPIGIDPDRFTEVCGVALNPASPPLLPVQGRGCLHRLAGITRPARHSPPPRPQALEMPEVKANIAQLLNRWVGWGCGHMNGGTHHAPCVGSRALPPALPPVHGAAPRAAACRAAGMRVAR